MADVPPLVAEACTKAALVWIRAGSERARPVWHVWAEGTCLVLTGGDEQPDPGLAGVEQATVTVRSKDKGSRLVGWVAHVGVIAPGSHGWVLALPLLKKERLNLVDAEGAEERWARDCVLYALVPTGQLVPPDAGSGAAPPPETPAATSVPLPFLIGRRPHR